MAEYIENLNKVLSSLDRQYVWRIREIHELRKMHARTDGVSKNTIGRSLVIMSCAHWEGFVKEAVCRVIEYLRRNCGYASMPDGMKGHSFLRKVKIGFDAKNPSGVYFGINQELISGEGFQMGDFRKHIFRIGNMKYDNFMYLLNLLGIDVESYRNEKPFIDDRLVECRHKIAHGEQLIVPDGDIETVVAKVVDLIQRFKVDLELLLSFYSKKSRCEI